MTFNKNLVLEDAYVTGFDSKFDVQGLLEKNKSFLAKYKYNNQFASDLINSICSPLDIDSRLILIRLQVEQGLITKQSMPSQSVLDRCLGFGMTDSGDIEKYYGFSNQIHSAATWWRNRWYSAESKIGVQIKTSDKILVFPQNKATYLSYVYTPWVGYQDYAGNEAPFGNYLVWLVKRHLFEVS